MNNTFPSKRKYSRKLFNMSISQFIVSLSLALSRTYSDEYAPTTWVMTYELRHTRNEPILSTLQIIDIYSCGEAYPTTCILFVVPELATF